MILSDYLYSKASLRRVPLMGTFELSPVCNFSCRMCYVRKTMAQITREGKSLIPWQSWLELARDCHREGMLFLLLTGGEPFLYPGFRELYTRLHEMGIILYINTNGTMIDEDTVLWLKQYAPARVNITLYGSSRETYRRICGQGDGYDRAMKAIHMLKDAAIPVVINASMIPENADDLETIIETGRSLGLNTRVATYMFPPVRREQESGDSRFTPEESAAIYLRKLRCQMPPQEYCDYLSRHQQLTASAVSDDWGSHLEFMKCRAGRSTFWVNWEGHMTACGMVDFPVVKTPFVQSFRDCWQELTEMVRSTPVLRGCAGCEKREFCNPCVAMIYSETGTVDQPAPYMCQLADSILAQMKREQEEIAHE